MLPTEKTPARMSLSDLTVLVHGPAKIGKSTLCSRAEKALFIATDGFYVKCDAETNPPEVRAACQVITEIGVNIVETAEFVIFRIAQWSGGRRITE